jgi:hypothetical protein
VQAALGGAAAPLIKVENTINPIARHLSLGDSIPGLLIAPLVFPTIPIIPGLSFHSGEVREAKFGLRYDERVQKNMYHPMNVPRERLEIYVLSTHSDHERPKCECEQSHTCSRPALWRRASSKTSLIDSLSEQNRNVASP